MDLRRIAMELVELQKVLTSYVAEHRAELERLAEQRERFFARLCAERSEAR
jgi:hypothetical protein